MGSIKLLLGLFILIFIGCLMPVVSGQHQCRPNVMRRPDPTTWRNRGNRNDKSFALLEWMIGGCSSADSNCPIPEDRHVEYEGYDGWYNNLANPSLGAVDTPLQRLLPNAYNDGVYQPVKRRVNPLNVSRLLMEGGNGMYSKAGRTAFMVFFGQQVVEEILDAQGAGCPPEYFNIDIYEDHEYRQNAPYLGELPLLRTRYDMRTGFSPNNPRQQLNEITPYLDGGLVYGTSKGWSDVLRLFANGTLAPHGKLAWHDELGEGFPAQNAQRLPMANPPPPTNHSQFTSRHYTSRVERFFKLGNPRGNENPFLLTFGIFWFRWHNYIAEYLHEKHSNWSGEKIFNEARKWVIATYQAIVLYDWLPKYMRNDPTPYEGYKPSIDPQVSHVFQSAAMRFGHTLVTSGVYLRDRSDNQCSAQSFKLSPDENSPSKRVLGVRTCNSFWRSPELFTSDPQNFERFLMGLSSQSSEREDHIIVEDLRGRVFGPLEFSRRDLMAINIQRGRDHGLPDYNTARKHFGLDPLPTLNLQDFRDITRTEIRETIITRLGELYSSPDEVDIWPGGLLETTKGPGQLFSRIILDQFQRTRDGDRFWFENEKNGLFTMNESCRIRQIRIVDILLAITNLVPGDDIQKDPFIAVHRGNNISSDCFTKLNEEVDCLLPNNESQKCRYLTQLSNSNAELCTTLQTYDYFSGSEISYILTFFFVLASCAALAFAVITKSKVKARQNVKTSLKTVRATEHDHKAKERVATRETRYVIVSMVVPQKRMIVKDTRGKLLRMLDFAHVSELTVRHLQDFTRIVLKIPNHYDLYLIFHDSFTAEKFKMDVDGFCEKVGIQCNYIQESVVSLAKGLVTVYEREKMLAEFSRLALSHAFSDNKLAWLTGEVLNIFSKDSRFMSMEITQSELASQLGMLPNSIFVEQLFHLMDYNKSGFITIKEFWDVMVVFAQGSKEEKAKLMFNIYDLSHTGSISSSDLLGIVRSTLGNEGKNRDMNQVVKTMLQSVGLREGQSIDFQKFKQIFDTESDVFGNVFIDIDKNAKEKKESRFSLYGSIPVGGLAAEAARREYEEARQEILTREEKDETPTISHPFMDFIRTVVNYIKSREQYLFWGTLYTIVMLLIFVERAYYYTIEREHGGLRRIAGLGVTITRGAASAMMFTFSTLLVTMCRNLLSHLRSTSIHRFFPFDEMVSFHRYVGHWALFWTICHIIGHAINFYHIATQTSSDLSCIFRDYFRSSHVLPKFHYWCWETITGLTGVLLTLQTAVIYVYAYFSRRYFFRYFWWTHNTYPLFYILMILHGSGRLVQDPFFHFFFLGPCILFVIDKVISMSHNRIKIAVKSAIHLPSNVILLKIQRPPDFNFLSGQWIRIASLGISDLEYHPFTLSSAPHETDLTLHIRAVGPWTYKLLSVYPDESQKTEKYPEIYVDGPFGEGHQMWWNFELVIFVAGGIGITPFASILKDITHKLQYNRTLLKTRKVIFLWVTKSQKQFEWMTDVLRKVESVDTNNIIRTHIFITQFKSKYDLRTIMLYLAERHFQKVSGTSLFTGLRAITHFSRPDFTSIFKSIKRRYSSVPVIGVFTCGNPSLSGAVDEGCQALNKEETPLFKHYYENF
ncbi:hypothetical protein SK128_006644 [Halocaridina rubra]|uniref:NAD(P)H oxidase (H2O2-forming) n=1 Tax=Halocaridina rubra TaxID=373956 RepID=A0AAN8WSD7_HALRR